MSFLQVNNTINSLSTGYQKHTSCGKDADSFTATIQTYLFLQTPALGGRDQPHIQASACLAAPCTEDPVGGETPSPVLERPTSAGMLSPMGTSCPSSAPATHRAGTAQGCFSAVINTLLQRHTRARPGWYPSVPDCHPHGSRWMDQHGPGGICPWLGQQWDAVRG